LYNSLLFNALGYNSIVSNSLVGNVIIVNGLAPTGSRLGELNGVAVEAVILPSELGR